MRALAASGGRLSTRGSSLPTAPKRPIRCSRAWFALVAGGAPDQLDEAVERVVDVAAEQVEVGDQGLGVDVVGRGGRGRAGRLEVDVLGALEQPGDRQAGGGLDVGGVGVDELLVLRDRERRSRRPRARPGRGRSAGRRGSSPPSASTGRPCRGWWRPVMPCAVSCCMTWVERRAQLVDRQRRPGAAAPGGRRGRRPRAGPTGSASPARSPGAASMSTRPARKRPSNSVGQRGAGRRPAGRSRASACASRRPAAPARSSTPRPSPGGFLGRRRGVRRRPAGAPPPRRAGRRVAPPEAAGAVRLSPERSTAPGRLNGCCVMATNPRNPAHDRTSRLPSRGGMMEPCPRTSPTAGPSGGRWAAGLSTRWSGRCSGGPPTSWPVRSASPRRSRARS